MDSMEEIYKNHAKTVYGFLLARTGHPDTAEELTQETFYRAVKNLKEFRGESSISTWLCGIAKHVWLEDVKKKKRSDLDAVPEDLFVSLWDTQLPRWENMQVLKALHQLKEPMRETVYLRLVGNLSFAQIGEIMDRSENWARVTFYRAKEIIIKEVKRNE